MAIETKQLHALSRIYKEQVAEDMQKGYVVTAADKKGNTKAWQGYKSGAKKKDGTPLYTAADHLKDEVEYVSEGPSDVSDARTKAQYKGPGAPGLDAHNERIRKHKERRGVKKESMQHRRNPEGSIKDRFKSRQTDPSKDNFTGIGDSIEDIMKQNAAMKKAAAKKTKKESFSNWRQDLKEIPDYEQIPSSAKKRNEKISEKNVKNTVKINPEMKESVGSAIDKTLGAAGEIADTAVKLPAKAIGYAKGLKKGLKKAAKKGEDKASGDASPKNESYETTKRKEVLSALKRDKRPLDKKTKEKIAAKIVKDKGDTSKSDDRYAYESKLWDEVAENLTELGELGGVKYKVVPLDESDIADILARLEKKRISKGGNPDESPLGKKTGRAMKAQQDKARKKAGLE